MRSMLVGEGSVRSMSREEDRRASVSFEPTSRSPVGHFMWDHAVSFHFHVDLVRMLRPDLSAKHSPPSHGSDEGENLTDT